MASDEFSDDVLVLETDERFQELDELVKDVMARVTSGELDPANGYEKLSRRSREIFPLVATDPVIGKRLLVDRAHTIMLLSILERLGRLERR